MFQYIWCLDTAVKKFSVFKCGMSMHVSFESINMADSKQATWDFPENNVIATYAS